MDDHAPPKYWFGKKSIGIGTGPTSWQGWLLMAGLLIVLGAILEIAGRFLAPSPWRIAFVVAGAIGAFAVFFWLMGRHTDPGAEF